MYRKSHALDRSLERRATHNSTAVYNHLATITSHYFPHTSFFCCSIATLLLFYWSRASHFSPRICQSREVVGVLGGSLQDLLERESQWCRHQLGRQRCLLLCQGKPLGGTGRQSSRHDQVAVFGPFSATPATPVRWLCIRNLSYLEEIAS